MNHRRVNLMLRASAGLLALLAVGAVVGGLLSPLPTGESDGIEVARARPVSRPTAAALPPLPEFERVWNRRLRPSFDTVTAANDGTSSVVAAPATASPAVSASAISLVGTIGENIALIRDASGSVEARQVGETIAGVGTVVAVRPSEVDLQQDGRRVTLRRAPETPEPSPIAPLSMPRPDPAEEPQIGPVVDGQ